MISPGSQIIYYIYESELSLFKIRGMEYLWLNVGCEIPPTCAMAKCKKFAFWFGLPGKAHQARFMCKKREGARVNSMIPICKAQTFIHDFCNILFLLKTYWAETSDEFISCQLLLAAALGLGWRQWTDVLIRCWSRGKKCNNYSRCCCSPVVFV